MKRILLAAVITGIVVICASCASTVPFSQINPLGPYDTIAGRPAAEAFERDYWITRPMGSTITVVGVAGRKWNRDEAIEDALLDAAGKVSLYYGAYGEFTQVSKQGSGFLEYYEDTSIRVDFSSDPASYIDALAFNKETDVFEKNGSVYVRATFSGANSIPPYTSGIKKERPSWIFDGAVDISGYYAGIGGARNKGSIQRTYEESYKAAIISVLRQISNQNDGSITEREGGGRVTMNTSTSQGNVSGIMILETWFNRQTNEVWTLIAAKAD